MEYHRMFDSSPSYLTHLNTATAVKNILFIYKCAKTALILFNIDWATDHELVHCLSVGHSD